MLKLIGLICMIAGAAGAGYSMSVQVGRRYRQLQELQRMVALLMGEITYACTPIPEAMELVGNRLEPPFSAFLTETGRELMSSPSESLSVIFGRHVKEDLRKSCLVKKDLESLCRMGASLGYLDRDMQLRTLRLYEEELHKELAATYESMPGKKKLYQTLGIMGGLFLVILLL